MLAFDHMKVVLRVALSLLAATLVYIVGYFISAQKFASYCGSQPIWDPNWSKVISVEPTYRFFSPSFWNPVHHLDRSIRPDYWTYTVRADRSNSPLVDGTVRFTNSITPTLWQTVFPTLASPKTP